MKLDETKGHFILGIDGLSRSGKTTFVRKLASDFETADKNVHIFHLDDYIVNRNRRYHTDQEEWKEYYYLQWDTVQLRASFFQQVHKANALTLAVYDSEADCHVEEMVDLNETEVIVVEGVFLQREEWRSFFDWIIYLDCPREERWKREKEETRANLVKFQTRYWKAEDFYLETVEPDKKADCVIRT
ncbi:uridine kinase [Halobacillus sp. BBL2006]|nr:uridine kinase [Halobacillus sp. BBL2006]